MPSVFQPNLTFYKAWKKFVKQIPHDSRSIIKTYQHFIVLGSEKSGKTELIQGLIEQSQDLYPFDTTYTQIPEMQFYIGPRQIFEEMSFSSLENRSIKARKQMIRLWKKLYAKLDPIVVIAYNFESAQQRDLRELNKLAQLIGGKISLLAEIGKRSVQMRIALTHLDKIPGYLEFARFLKQQNINFSINLSSNFESNTLSSQLKEFSEEYLSLILTTVSPTDYEKILQFFKEMPQIFSVVEEFLRALVSHVSFRDSIKLDMLAFTTNQEQSTSFSIFQWSKLPPTTLFFRYPTLKHQITAGFIFLSSVSVLMNYYYHTRNELLFIQKGVELLDLLQVPAFKEQIVSNYGGFANSESTHLLGNINPHFFENNLQLSKDKLAHRIRKHLIEPEFRKVILENKGEFKYLYFLGLFQASENNNIGKFVYKNAHKWTEALGFETNLIKLYVSCCSQSVLPSLVLESKTSPFLPLTSLEPWYTFLKKFKEITDQPVFIEQPYDDDYLIKETDKLFTAISRLRNDSLVFAIATLLDEEGFKENENIKTVHWVGENLDSLDNFLHFIKQTSVPPINVKDLNLTQFFAKIKDISLLSYAENELYNFTINNQLFSFDTNKWVNHIIVHSIEQAIQDYIASNIDTNGAIFFINTSETPEPSLARFQELFPVLKTNFSIPGRYSRGGYEKKVRSPAEKLVSFVESLPINPEEKNRFTNFITREAVSYIKNYQTKYAKFFDSYEVQTDSTKGLIKLINELSQPSSNFYDFLRTIHHQTGVFSEPILALKNIEELNEFAFLDRILQQTEGKPAPILEYQKLMGELLKELETTHPKSASTEYIFPHLAPAARLSLNILHNRPDSYLLKVQECLNKMDIPEKFHRPFSKPILLVYKTGLQELKNYIEELWDKEFAPKVDEVLSKFPFQPQEATASTRAEIEHLFSPKSEFYKNAKELFSTCFYQKNRKWVPINPDLLTLRESICLQFNQVSKISDLLWDGEGNPKSLTFKISSVPFMVTQDQAIPILTYVVAGEQTLYNFNQSSTSQNLNIEWWKPESCYIGMEILNRHTNVRSFRNIQGPLALWSFFSLLNQGKQEGLIYSWTLSANNGKDPRAISFKFEANPLEIFRNESSL